MNRLADETSPYLLQHKDNPVHWWPWGPEALAEAKATGKPVLLSVGYAACHWCHVMAHESFEDDATAEVMNDLFVCIKVDREERPDIDAIYMGALHRMGEQGGWPLTMFLDGDGRPFYGGTYFPKDQRYGRASFTSVLRQVSRIFNEDRATVEHNGRVLTEMLSRSSQTGASGTAVLDLSAVAGLIGRMPRAMDPVNGGLKGAPKFPQWSFMALLWRGAIRFGDSACRDASLLALDRMSQGGIYDHLAGGLARYSVDEFWLAPHFEKMLYDNAQYVDLLTEAWRETREPLFEARVRETVGWLLSEMVTADGAFAASLDADSEGEEGRFYVWSAGEIREVLGPDDAADFGAVYDVTDGGNWEGHTILNRLRSGGLRDAATERRLADMRAKLLARRAGRIRPGLDDKVLADWNGLMIAALSRAAVVFREPAWLAAAERAFAVIVRLMTDGDPAAGRLFHAYRAGRTTARAVASDYADMIRAGLRLCEATGEPAYLSHARAWTAALDRHHWVSEGGGYATSADDATDVLVRMRGAGDDAAPNANAVMVANLAALALLTEDSTYLERADALRGAFAGDLANQPISFCGLIANSIDAQAALHVAVTGNGDERRHRLEEAVHASSLPGAIETIVFASGPAAGNGQGGAGQSAAAIVCAGQTCSAPTADPVELRSLLQVGRRIPTVTPPQG